MYYYYDGTLPVAELNSSGAVIAINTFGVAGLVSRTVTGAGNTLYAFDERGNVASHKYSPHKHRQPGPPLWRAGLSSSPLDGPPGAGA